MEVLLHYIWKNKLFNSTGLFTSEGIPIKIIDPGMPNSHAGPDFFNAKIKIGDQIWAGNVEIHLRSSDWIRHGHQQDKAYNSVILHVVGQLDLPQISGENKEPIPQLIIDVPESIKENYEYLLNKDIPIPCLDRIPEIPGLYLTDWLNSLTVERLEVKTRALNQLLNDHHGDWSEVFYITLSRNFGFGINNDAFERLAKSLPVKYIIKNNDSLMKVEALLFGQAGLLESNEIKDEYSGSLKREYDFFRKKYRLKPLESFIFKNLRIRPNNFPHIKIAQLASLIYNQDFLFSKMLETTDVNDLRNLFTSNISPYWKTHYNFRKTSSQREKTPGKSSLDIILINTVIPILFTYGRNRSQPEIMSRAIDLLESIAPEKNSIITLFSRTGIQISHAADTQALIQLKKEYCDQKKCIFCRIGYKLLANQ